MIRDFKGRAVNWVMKKAPSLFWKPYGRMAAAAGLDRLYLILSFDCDAKEDIDAAAELDDWLRVRGVKATYAVPGTQLEQGASVYREIASKGSEFLNHGYLPHTEWREGRYFSRTFYDRMAESEVVDDINRGHETVGRIIGTRPQGFRAPHFGCFQSESQLSLQYSTLKALGYRYSTSTLPRVAYRHGPVREVGGIVEVPLTGSFRFPFIILDSWTYLESYYQPVVKRQYADLFIQTAASLAEMGIPGVLNVYVDPAHVHKSEHFRNAIERTLDLGVRSLDYGELLDLTAKKSWTAEAAKTARVFEGRD
jgi:hypothetical protein